MKRVAAITLGIGLAAISGSVIAAPPGSSTSTAVTVLLYDAAMTMSSAPYDSLPTLGPIDIASFKTIRVVVSATSCSSEDFTVWVHADGVLRDQLFGPPQSFPFPTPLGMSLVSKTYDDFGVSVTLKLRNTVGMDTCQGRVQVYGAK
jgi:hypothetical protein